MAINDAPLESEFLTVMVTLFRLAFRLKIQRFWWEDMWAAVAMVVVLGLCAPGLHSVTSSSLDNFRLTHISGLISSYSFTCIVWSVRMSLLYSTIRVVLPSTVIRVVMRVIGALFVVVWAVLIGLKTWWHVNNQVSTHGHRAWSLMDSIEVFEATVDFAGDATLVIFSLRLLWGVKLPRRQRRMILAVFSSSAIITMVSLPRAIASIIGDDTLACIMLDLELIFSSIVCNLLVVVTYIYRVYVNSSESEISSDDDDFTTPLPNSPRSLTTVDLNTPDLTTIGTTDHFRSSFFPSLGQSTTS
ncbi:hypothetical protein EV363DRAFT_1397623 [Boletus edulis]|nr:hypothetical protein EV363DRAFT_1397623 [Boletus edulis]